MDACAGTNKSQYFMGGLGLLLSCGVLDCAMLLFMVVGHTKFGPDLVARQIAGMYNRGNTFNHRQLINHMRPYATAGAYDGDLLLTWKDAAKDVFSPVSHIMSYRCFVLLADDGCVDLGAPREAPVDFEPFIDEGDMYDDAVLMRECNRAAYRGIKERVLPALLDNKYRGVGQGAVGERCSQPSEARLLPRSVVVARRVRLFTRRSSDDVCWREQSGWMKKTSTTDINKALAAVQPYASSPERRKEPYGNKAKNLEEQNARYVPHEFVPDKYNLTTVERSSQRAVSQQTLGHLRPTTMAAPSAARGNADSTTDGVSSVAADGELENGRNVGGGEAAARPDAQVKSRVRWSTTRHKARLLEILLDSPYNGELPRKSSDWEQITAEMPVAPPGQVWDPETVRRNAKVLVKSAAGLV